MTTAYSTNLGLALPVQGELSGTWGDTVNNGITQYTDISVAGTLSLSGDGAVTLSVTNGSAAGTNIGSTTAQYAILRITGTLTTTKVITAPAASKTYIVINDSTGGYSVTLRGTGPTTGVNIVNGETALCVWNGSDFEKVFVAEVKAAISASAINLLAGSYFTKTITTTTTFTISNTPASGTVASFVLDLTNGGSYTVNWWSGVTWPGGTAPTLTASGRDSLGFYTYDGGTTWTGLVLGLDVK